MSNTIIQLKKGTFKDIDLTGYQFVMIKACINAGYVTVDGSTANPPNPDIPARAIRVICGTPQNYNTIGEAEADTATTVSGTFADDSTVAHLSDNEIVERIRARFSALEHVTQAVKDGVLGSMIVSGPPGVGKSSGILDVLQRDSLFDVIADKPLKYEIMKGVSSAIGLYKKLYAFKDRQHVLVLDDCDSVFYDKDAINLLKGAMDTGKNKTISWNTESVALRREDIPTSFTFSGNVIVVTNLKESNIRSKTVKMDFQALATRCQYFDMQMSTIREMGLRIKQVVQDGMLNSYGFTDAEKDEVVNFVIDNRHKLRDVSLRSAVKVADLKRALPNQWKEIAAITVLREVA